MIETHSTTMNSAHYARMGKEECEKIHLASLEILQRVGVDVHDEKARGSSGARRRKGGWTACAHPGIYGGPGALHCPQAHHALQPQRQGGNPGRRISLVFRRRVGLPECARPPHR